MNKRKLGALVGAAMLTLTFAGTALANDVHQELPIVGTDFKSTVDACGEGWHFVHVGAKADALPSELTATFKDAGTVKVAGYVNGNGIVMYNVHVDPSDRLLSASDDISDDANLNLSHVCLAESTTSTTTTANDTTSSETTADETTTAEETTAEETTTTESTITDATTTITESTTTDESTTSAASVDDHGVTGGTTTTSSSSSEATTPGGHVEGLTPPATDTIGASTSSSTVSTSMLLVLAGVLSFVLVGIPAAARKRR